MTEVRVYDLEVSEFEHQSPYHIHFRTNTIGKALNPLFP